MSLAINISPERFAREYQEQRPLLMKGAASSDPVFSWRDINALLERSDPFSDDFKLLFNGVRPKHEYVESYLDVGSLRHRLIKPVIYDYLRRGATLIANKIKNEPSVDRFARDIGIFSGRQVVSSAYVAFGTKDSFRCHWDTRDVFAIQLIGRKRWIVYEPSLEAPLYTQQSRDLEHRYPCPSTPYMDIVLEPGDVFYLPRGWWHNPSPLGEPSFHLSLGTFPALIIDFLQWAITQMENVTAARQSLSRWEHDRANLEAVAQQLNALLGSPGEYNQFMQEYLSQTRTDSTLAVERFGDPNVQSIPRDARLRLCANDLFGMDNDSLIANGTALTLDEISAPLIRYLAGHPGITLCALVDSFPQLDGEKICQLCSRLCDQDVIEIII